MALLNDFKNFCYCMGMVAALIIIRQLVEHYTGI